MRDGTQRCRALRLLIRPVVFRRFVDQRPYRQVGLDAAVAADDEIAGVRDAPNNGEIQLPLAEHGFRRSLRAGFQDHQHALLAFRQHQLVRGHARFALWHEVEVDVDADATLRRHLDGRRGQARRTHVLNGDNRVHAHELEAGFQQQLFGEWIPYLHRGSLFLPRLALEGAR